MGIDTTRAMQDALQAAVARMNGAPNGAPPAPEAAPPTDAMGLIGSLLPRLLAGNQGGQEELAEKLEGLQRDEIAPLRAEVQVLRKQVHRLLRAQEAVLAELRALREQHSTVCGAVLDLAHHMARVEIIEEPPQEDPGRGAAEPAETRANMKSGKHGARAARGG